MPQMADAPLWNGTANDTFVALAPASGDRGPARWRFEDTTVPPNCRPTMECSSRWNGKRDARHVDVKLVVPYVITNTSGLKEVIANILFTGTFVIPTSIPDTNVDKARQWISSALATGSLVSLSAKAGYAPT